IGPLLGDVAAGGHFPGIRISDMVGRSTMWSRALILTVLSLVLLAAGCKTEAARHQAAGNMLFNQGDYDQARAEYAKAVEAAPDDPGARTLLGNALLELGAYTDARAQYEKALELDAESPEAHRGI